ncbi:MAG: hypothetical protein GF399_01120 [Candidatus Coatesbacteria bacterium]|nr:hypothetical protein [Candidatus Coatesbacteria bacterium]
MRERRVNRPSCNYRCADGRYRRKRCGKLFKRRPRGVATRRRRAAARQAALDMIVYSDDWKANKKLSLNGFHHKRINHDKTLVNGKVHINGLETSGTTPSAAKKPTTTASSVTADSLSVKGRSASTIETPKTR